MIGFIEFADKLSAWFGKAFGWLIILMTLGMSYEVASRYLFNAPTTWSLDVSFIMYGTLFMMGGAYTLSRGTQAKVDLVLYIFFFFPGVTALILSGWKYAARSWGYGEVSVNSPAGVPIFQFKAVIVAAGILLFIQGIAQVMRCILCIREGFWRNADDDVQETEELLMKQRVAKED